MRACDRNISNKHNEQASKLVRLGASKEVSHIFWQDLTGKNSSSMPGTTTEAPSDGSMEHDKLTR